MKKRTVDILITLMLLMAIYFALFGGEYTLFQLGHLRTMRADAASQLTASDAQLDSLKQLADRLRSDPQAIERVARERYGMIRDGEILYRFRDGGN